MGFLQRFFSRGNSREKAKKRLQLVLIHDRADISPMMLENLRTDLIDVINKYMEIDVQNIEMDLDRDNGSVALVANIPVVSIKRGSKADRA